MLKRVASLQWSSPWFKRVFDRVASTLNQHDGRVQQGIGAGLAFNPGGSNAGYLLGTSEPGVQRAFFELARPGGVVWDVGANVGFHTVLCARLVGPTGSVVAFEPLDRNVRCVEHNVRLNGFANVLVRAEALGGRDGEAVFEVSRVSSWGRLVEVGSSPKHVVDRVPVRVRTIDSVCAEPDAPPPPTLIKIDVEGAELGVLDGASSTIAAHRPVLMIELHGTGAAVEAKLTALGYTTRVLGSSLTIAASPWDAYVLAAPADAPDVVARIERLTDGSVGTR